MSRMDRWDLYLQLTACFVFAVSMADSADLARDRKQVHHTQHPHTPHPTGHSHPGSHDPLSSWLSKASSSRPNVLFLIVDDLRPKLGCYGESNMVTPNIDQLASKSVRFDRAYVQQAICAASRSSFLTGRRPDTTHVINLQTYWRAAGGNFTTLPQYFKEHGYVTQGVGKIYHPGHSSGGDHDQKYSWSLPYYHGSPAQHFDVHQSTMQAVNVSEVGKLVDMDVADFSVDFLRNHSKNNHNHKPFFLAVGFRKPHLPWRYPKEYTGIYPLSRIHLARHNTHPPLLPRVAWSDFGELRQYHDIIHLHLSQPYHHIPDDYQLKLRQAYSSAVSYTDAQVGRVLAALDQNGLTDNTIIFFLGDHGWQLGENGEWCKHTNFEIAVRVPFMVSVPGVTSSDHHFRFIDPLTVPAGTKPTPVHHHTNELVEAVDIFPTMTQLSGLPVPKTCPADSRHVPVCTEGTSLVPVLEHVSTPHGVSFQWKKAAFSQYPRNGEHYMGYTVRTDKHRYTEWVHYDRTHYKPDFSHLIARELYVEDSDPDEFNNVANVTSYSSTVETLSQLLRAGWQSTLQDYLVRSGQSN